MLTVIKDVVKSKTMVGVMVFIIGISYMSAANTAILKNNDINSIEVVQELN